MPPLFCVRNIGLQTSGRLLNERPRPLEATHRQIGQVPNSESPGFMTVVVAGE